jgi:NAD(P)-dependent dehydrogenase (short-subunit alcohol dehydrogenase family)
MVLRLKSVDEKVAFITGGASGIGFGIAEALSRLDGT